jgi:hypothetical protein
MDPSRSDCLLRIEYIQFLMHAVSVNVPASGELSFYFISQTFDSVVPTNQRVRIQVQAALGSWYRHQALVFCCTKKQSTDWPFLSAAECRPSIGTSPDRKTASHPLFPVLRLPTLIDFALLARPLEIRLVAKSCSLEFYEQGG